LLFWFFSFAAFPTFSFISLTFNIHLMAGQEGIEPPTCGFGDRRSAN
jgi:hypothetical protein